MEKINVNFSELNNGYEIFWILLSIFDLPIEHQKNVIGIVFLFHRLIFLICMFFVAVFTHIMIHGLVILIF